VGLYARVELVSDGLGCLVKTIHIASHQGDVSAEFGKRVRNCSSDSSTAAGNDGVTTV